MSNGDFEGLPYLKEVEQFMQPAIGGQDVKR